MARTANAQIAAPVTAEQQVAPRPANDVVPAAPQPLPLGLHFGLDEALYHADLGLGSSSLRQLAKNPFNYWFDSPLNPMRCPDEETTESLEVGRAMHKIVFEGREAFDSIFMRGPDQTGMTSGEKSASTRKARKEASEQGKISLKFDKFARTLISGQMIRKNPHLARVFSGGQAEVSLIWNRTMGDTVVRLKARFDYLKCEPRQHDGGRHMLAANGDLKTVGNWQENDFVSECHSAIARYRYDAQAAHYLDGLRLVPSAIDEGNVYRHNGADVSDDWLERFLFRDLRFAWQWIFYQSTGAPITHSLTLSPENPMLDCGRQVIARGIERYVQCMKEFGPDEMWVLAEQPQEAMIEHLPGWFGR